MENSKNDTQILETTAESAGSSLDSPVHVKSNSTSILVNPVQKGNKVLDFITSVPWEYDNRIVADYVMGQTTCALFLSLVYHNLHPDYIHKRLKLLGKNYKLRVLILLVPPSVKDPSHTLNELTRISILCDLTLLICRSDEEAGKMIERYKIYQFKPPDLIMEKKDANPYIRVSSALTSVRSINKSDAMILLANFGTLAKICRASEADLSTCPGLGHQKASRLFKVLREPFLMDSGPPAKKTKRS